MNNNKLVIRKTKLEDLPKICSLFEEKKENVLKWILSNIQNKNSLCSYVAVNQSNRIIGHIGYVQNKYYLNDTELISIHPIEWMIDKELKGSLGIMLMKKITCLGDFIIIIGGTKDAQLMYPFFGFQSLGNAKIFSKIIDYPKYLLLNKSFKKKIITIFKTKHNINSFFNKKHYGNLSIKSISILDPKFRSLYQTNGINISIDKAKINWLFNCPLHQKYIIQINYSYDLIGYAILFFNNKTKTVRIIDIICKREEVELYSMIIDRIINFCKKLCAIDINVLSTNKILLKAFEKENFHFSGNKPIFTKINNNHLLNDAIVQKLNLSYAEGDIGYRF